MENMNPSYAGEGMYKENIIDHYKHPHNKGTIEDADVKFTENNPLCGDVITITLKLNDNKVEDIKFSGQGCAISQAATSMLTDEMKGKTLEEIKNLNREKVVEMLGIEIGPVRTKCAVLGLVAVKEGIKQFENKENNNSN
jgi:nitrogen fixation NifU-like protein|tara:strand:- start:766 stop:1185 length:420 start_codon:yes stop_codon:yes gene_type:complete